MNRCETCKFWKRRERAWQAADERAGGWCNNDKICEGGPYEADSLVYSYCEGGSFWTGPKFGCVHHEAAE